MKNEKNTKFFRDPSKIYVRKFRFYPSFLYNKLDKWLNQMSLLGWHLVDSNPFSFLFEQGDPENKIYFTYNSNCLLCMLHNFQCVLLFISTQLQMLFLFTGNKRQELLQPLIRDNILKEISCLCKLCFVFGQ